MDATPPQPPLLVPRRRWLVTGLLLLFVGLSIPYAFKALENRSAFIRWRAQILDLEQGVDIYRVHAYPNPPVMALLLAPLAKLPPLVGALGWYFLKVAMTLAALAWVFRLLEQSGQPFPLSGRVLAVLLSLRPIIGDLSHGNVNLLILFLIVAALTAHRRRHDLSAGLLLGLAVACKVTPALFIPYFLWKRSWKVVAGCTAGIGLFLWPGVVPGAVLGWQRNQELLHSWTQQMVVPYLLEGAVTSEHQNQSLPGLLYRLTTESPSFSVYDEVLDTYLPTEYHNLLALSPELAGWLVKGCMLLFGVAALWACRTPTAPRRGWRLAAEYSLVVLGMLLFCERTWKHHCVTLLLPFAVLSYCLTACRPGRWLRTYLIGTLVVVVLLIATTSTGLLPDGAAKLAQVYGAYVWAYLLLAGALVVLLRTPEARTQPVLPYLAPARRFTLIPPRQVPQVESGQEDRQREPFPPITDACD